MALATKWTAEWFGRKGGHYWAYIYLDGHVGASAYAPTAFECPAEISWPESGKFDPVQGSSLTLHLISDTDREFYNLYTIKPGGAMCKVWKDGHLYWSGTLDPEIYEEPYATEKGYEVSVTFTDFGILDRERWQGGGMLTIGQAVTQCLDNVALRGLTVNYRSATTSVSYGIEELKVRAENFYNEEGEGLTKREVLEALLQPFGLKAMQKAGAIWICDNTSLKELPAEEIAWDSTDQWIHADKVLNNVKVTFAQNGATDLMAWGLDHDTLLKDNTGSLIWLDTSASGAGQDDVAEGFRFATGQQPGSAVDVMNNARFVRFDAIFSGSDACSVGMKVQPRQNVIFEAMTNAEVARIQGGYLGATSNNYALKVAADLLFSVRYNPFEPASGDNESGNDGRFEDKVKSLGLKCHLLLVDDNGTPIEKYQNDQIFYGTELNIYNEAYGFGRWVRVDNGDPGEPCFILNWYDDKHDGSGINGWTPNKHCRYAKMRKELPSRFAKISNELVTLPPSRGRLELRIYYNFVSYGDNAFTSPLGNERGFAPVRWIAIKDVAITLVKARGAEIDFTDIEDSAWLNRDAEEGEEISTSIGTAPARYLLPTAKGAIYTPGGSIVNEATRDGVTDRLERLLIGDYYTQYADRHAVLTGEARLLAEFGPVTDSATPGTFAVLSEVQNLGAETSQIKAAELGDQTYEGIEYEQ